MAQRRRLTRFQDLLDSRALRTGVDELARPFRDRYGLPPVHQLGLVVPDVEVAAERLERQGIGPFWIANGDPVLNVVGLCVHRRNS